MHLLHQRAPAHLFHLPHQLRMKSQKVVTRFMYLVTGTRESWATFHFTHQQFIVKLLIA